MPVVVLSHVRIKDRAVSMMVVNVVVVSELAWRQALGQHGT